jgi:hypothetical protein
VIGGIPAVICGPGVSQGGLAQLLLSGGRGLERPIGTEAARARARRARHFRQDPSGLCDVAERALSRRQEALCSRMTRFTAYPLLGTVPLEETDISCLTEINVATSRQFVIVSVRVVPAGSVQVTVLSSLRAE